MSATRDVGLNRRYGLGTFSDRGGDAFAAVVVDGRVVRVDELLGTRGGTVAALLADWERSEPVLQDAVNALAAEAGAPLHDARPLVPVHPPGQLFCAGANYKQHVKQLIKARGVIPTGDIDPEQLEAQLEAGLAERARTGTPYVFLGLATAMSGAQDDIVLPSGSEQIDWELELAVVIGKRARRVSRDEALDYVAGYTISNDITLRDRVYRPDMPTIGTDWLSGKSAPTFFPTGPWITPARHVDPGDLRITLSVNGEIMQDESTSDMLFDVARLIEHVSSVSELVPGDVLLTGSPAGNGAHYDRYLKPGDLVRGEITGLGTLTNLCVAEGARA